jgi:hypothetical protein
MVVAFNKEEKNNRKRDLFSAPENRNYFSEPNKCNSFSAPENRN